MCPRQGYPPRQAGQEQECLSAGSTLEGAYWGHGDVSGPSITLGASAGMHDAGGTPHPCAKQPLEAVQWGFSGPCSVEGSRRPLAGLSVSAGVRGCAPGRTGAQQSGLPSGVRDAGTQRDRLLGAVCHQALGTTLPEGGSAGYPLRAAPAAPAVTCVCFV